MKPPSGFGDAEAKRVIQRAAELDAQDRDKLDVNAIREIASEAGISPTSIDRALAELSTPLPPRTSWLRRRAGLLIATAVILTILFSRLFP